MPVTACTHPSEWQSLSGKCLICGAVDCPDRPRSPMQLDIARIQRECAHRPGLIWEQVCFLCGAAVTEAWWAAQAH